MKVLILSHKFAPDRGGIERISETLANGFTTAGLEVRVATRTRDDDGVARPYEVLRRPTPLALLRANKEADVVFHNNPCLRFAWSNIFFRKPTVVAVRTWIRRANGRTGVRDWLKHGFLAHSSAVVANSHATAAHLQVESTVIHNGYDEATFHYDWSRAKTNRAMAFVGRLVEDKGIDLLLDAIDSLPTEAHPSQLDIIGDGPLRGRLEQRVSRYPFPIRVHGSLDPHHIAPILRSAEVMVVPSLWAEPFGIVAIEGMASACAVIASADGGLGEALGDAGLTFSNGRATELSACIELLMRDPNLRLSKMKSCQDRAKLFTARQMVGAYLDVVTQTSDYSNP